MIDTDKYEGYTEGPWILYTTASHGPTIAGKLNDADWQLIKDAPLLLAEVKRLREGIVRIAKVFDDKTIHVDTKHHAIISPQLWRLIE